jgi:hypothetical protein
MKQKLPLLFLFTTTLLSSPVFAEDDRCKTVDAHVVSIMPWEDGATFINLDKTNNCGCTIPSRFGFYPSDKNSKTYLAEALTAFATNSKITIIGIAGCSVHTNTAAIFTVILGGGM